MKVTIRTKMKKTMKNHIKQLTQENKELRIAGEAAFKAGLQKGIEFMVQKIQEVGDEKTVAAMHSVPGADVGGVIDARQGTLPYEPSTPFDNEVEPEPALAKTPAQLLDPANDPLAGC